MTRECDAEGCNCTKTFEKDIGMLCMIHLDYYENGYPFELKKSISRLGFCDYATEATDTATNELAEL